ncbi:MAG: hypothetical protein ACKOB6_08985 [Candidatus Kapaibacterium sp.]
MDASHTQKQLDIVWEGPQMVTSSLALVNREHSSNIIDSGVADVTIIPTTDTQLSPSGDAKIEKLWAHDIRQKSVPGAHTPVVWIRHQWPTNEVAPKGAK